MSYIRSASNPERLYIYGDEDGVEICRPQPYKTLRISYKVFNTLIKKWSRGLEDVSYMGASLQEVCNNREFKWRMSYEDWGGEFVDMYLVTLNYIADNVKKESVWQR